MLRRFKGRYRLVVAIGSAEHRNERRNPFSGNERKAMMEAYLDEAGIEGVRVVALEDGDSEMGSVENLIRMCKPDMVLLSTERRSSLDVALTKSGVRVVRFRRTGTVSSTLIRHLIATGNPGWRNFTGKSVARFIEKFGGIERIRGVCAPSSASDLKQSPLAVRGKAHSKSSRENPEPSRPVKVVEVAVPEYTLDPEPDYLAIGRKVDQAIEANFPDEKYILRAIGLDDHPGLALDELVRVILATGTDKHDPGRRAVGHDEFSGYDFDIQAGPVEIRHSRLVADANEPFSTIFGGIAWHFYHGAPLDRGHAVRIDILMLYDPKQVIRARKFLPGARGVRKGLNQFLYKFMNPKNKRDALRGLVKVLR